MTLVFESNAGAQTIPVRIHGTAPEYAGRQIDLLRPGFPVTEQQEVLASLNILPDGSFDASVLIIQTTYCYALFDRWKAEIYLAPGQDYELTFPPFEPLDEAEKRNPFFRPQEIAFSLNNLPDNDINRMIQRFETAYNQEENRYFDPIFIDKSTVAADSMIAMLNHEFPESNNSYFESYKHFRIAAIRFALNQDKSDEFVKTNIDRKPLNFNLPPFRQLFEQQFSNFFYNESNQVGGEKFRMLVGTANLEGIEKYLTIQKGWSTDLARLVILKGINDGFHQRQFKPGTMLELLDEIEQSSWTAEEKSMATASKTKLTYLMNGTEAPDIQLQTLEGKQIRLSTFRGKIVYLQFTTVTNPISRQHLDELKKIAPQFSQKVEFINLLPEADLAKKTLILQQNWPGRFMFVDDKALEAYRVKTFPTAYLIDENQLLVLSPALNPMDGLAHELAGILKNKRIEELRDQAK